MVLKLYWSMEEIPPHIKAKALEQARNAWADIWNYDSKVLYAVDWEELNDDPKTKRVLWVTDEITGSWVNELLVWPRPWTITPWSSKVWDILSWTWIKASWRVERVVWHKFDTNSENTWETLKPLIHDRMTQIVVPDMLKVWDMFTTWEIWKLKHIDIASDWIDAIHKFNKERWVWLNNGQIEYLYVLFSNLQRNPTDAELFAFAQGNSEHCHHWTFNGLHIINWVRRDRSLFSDIKDTHKANPNNTLSAYKDNAAALKWDEWVVPFVWSDWKYDFKNVPLAITLKAETHNHPTGISPNPWAATWAWWEIRDEWAVWRWSTPNVWTSWFFVSRLDNNLRRQQSWRVSAKEIMTEWPIWAASFNNEFGRPAISWDFRVFEQLVWWTYWWYHKPIMLAWWKWNVSPNQIEKKQMPAWTLIIQLWWPWMNIWLGWWSWSSLSAWQWNVELDFASVQRANPEMQRRCQEVINVCTRLWENPILAIHDVWAWWIWNATQEFIHDSWIWWKVDLRKIPVADPSLSPLETWSNESQERYVVWINPNDLEKFREICERENAPFAVIWELVEWRQFTVYDSENNWEKVIDLDIWAMLDHNVPLELVDNTIKIDWWELDFSKMNLWDSIREVISHPTVWNKSFLVTIWDRTVWWMTIQNQMVWPWQTPVSNVWVTLHWLEWKSWEVITTWERTPLAIVNPWASCRMAIWESITNLMSAYITDFKSIAWSWNWMNDKWTPGQLAALHEWVEALRDICIALWISIPVWKDSLSMKTKWPDWEIVSPLSLITTFYASTPDAYKTLTPEFKAIENSEIMLIDLWAWKNRMWWSMLAQVWNQFWNEVPDVDNPEILLNFMKAMMELHEKWLLLAYHDRSDGWLFATISEMSFASHLWVNLSLDNLTNSDDKENILKALFSEELWAVIQLKVENKAEIMQIFEKYWLWDIVHAVWTPNLDRSEQNVKVSFTWKILIDEKRVDLQKAWSLTSHNIQRERENPKTADQEFARIDNEQEPPMPKILTFDVKNHNAWSIIEEYENEWKQKPKVAVLRTQWTNWHIEMARYFSRAWFEVYDVHTNDLISWKHKLSDFKVISIAWGFSYWDALWSWVWFASVIKENESVREQFKNYEWYLMWVCNWCQTIGEIWDILPWGEKFPKFKRNTSTQFEARLSPVRIKENNDSIFLKWMWWSILPIISAHWEWRVEGWDLVSNLNYTDHNWNPTDAYPHNPNGSKDWATWYESWKVFFMMWHPEREPEADSAWLQIPLNLREQIENEWF